MTVMCVQPQIVSSSTNIHMTVNISNNNKNRRNTMAEHFGGMESIILGV